MPYKYNAFLSYSHTDMKLVRNVQLQLERWMPPTCAAGEDKKERLKVFRDKTDNPAGGVTENIREALMQSEYLILFCSKDSVKSDYVAQELELFITDHSDGTPNGRSKALGHVLFAGCEKSVAHNKKIVHRLLQKALGSVIPASELNQLMKQADDSLQADFSHPDGGSGRKKKLEESCRLAAKLYGVAFDDLWKRAKRYRNMVISIAALCIALILALGAASVTSYKSLRDREARRLALVADAQLKDGDRLLAAQLAMASMDTKLLYRKITPEAISVLADATRSYEIPSDLNIEKSAVFNIVYSGEISMDISQDGKYLAVMNDTNDLVVWDTQQNEPIWHVSSALNAFDPNVLFAGEDKLLVYWYGGCKCLNVKEGKVLWENTYDVPDGVLRFGFEGNSAMNLVIDDKFSDGLTNVKAIERKGESAILCLERKGGLVLRDAGTGSITEKLGKGEIDKLLPDGVEYYKDISYYPVKRISRLQKPGEIAYDDRRDAFLIPCYKNRTADNSKTSMEETYYHGLISWEPETGKADYITLADDDDDNKELYFENEILYPCSGVVIKKLDGTERIRLSAFDAQSGKKIWDYSYSAYVYEDVCPTRDGIVLINDEMIEVLDPESGNKRASFGTDLNGSEEKLQMILGSEIPENNDLESLDIVTSKGRICSIRDGEFMSGSVSQSVSEKGIRDMQAGLYVPAHKSYTGSDLLFCPGDNSIVQYEIGLANESFQWITATEGDRINVVAGDYPKLFAAGNKQYLLKTVDDSWEMLDASGSEPEVLWRNSLEQIDKTAKEKYPGDELKKYLQRLSYLGTDPASGNLLFYESDLYGFVEMDPQTGEISMEIIPAINDAIKESSDSGKGKTWGFKILSPVITDKGFNCILEIHKKDSFNYRLVAHDMKSGTGITSELATTDDAIDRIALFADPAGEYNVVLGLREGPVLIDPYEGGNINLNKAEDGDTYRDYMNNFFVDNRPDVLCRFDHEHGLFAINYFAGNRIVIYDVKGNVRKHFDYFNTLYTDMFFGDSDLILLTDDGRAERVRLKDMKLQKTVKLADAASGLNIIGTTGSDIWVQGQNDTAYCIDPDELACKQHIRNVGGADFDNGQVVVYDIHKEKVALGSLRVYSDEEIISRAKEYIGVRKIREEDISYFGL